MILEIPKRLKIGFQPSIKEKRKEKPEN